MLDARLVEQLRQAEWKVSPKTDAEWECECWAQPYRFVALRYEKVHLQKEGEQAEQYQLFETSHYSCLVFVTDLTDPIYFVVWFYNQRGSAENLV